MNDLLGGMDIKFIEKDDSAMGTRLDTPTLTLTPTFTLTLTLTSTLTLTLTLTLTPILHPYPHPPFHPHPNPDPSPNPNQVHGASVQWDAATPNALRYERNAGYA